MQPKRVSPIKDCHQRLVSSAPALPPAKSTGTLVCQLGSGGLSAAELIQDSRQQLFAKQGKYYAI
jgi:hypothetical protein